MFPSDESAPAGGARRASAAGSGSGAAQDDPWTAALGGAAPQRAVTPRGEPVDTSVVAGAAAAGGTVGLVAGLLVGLPVIAATAGAAAASYAAALKRDETGEKAREVGEQTVTMFSRARALSRQYRVSERLEEAAQTTAAAVQRFDSEHHVSARAASAASHAAAKAGEALEAAKAYNEEHRVLERAGEAAQKAGERIAVGARQVDERLHISDKAAEIIDQIAPLPPDAPGQGSHPAAAAPRPPSHSRSAYDGPDTAGPSV